MFNPFSHPVQSFVSFPADCLAVFLGQFESGFDTGQKLLQVEGFGNIVVGPDLQTSDLVVDLVFGGQHKDRNMFA